MYYLLKLDRSYRPNSNKTGQSDLHIGHTDRSDRSEGTTNKNKEKDLNKKNIIINIKTKNNILIKTIKIHNINWIDRNGTTGALIGEKEYWNRGFGTDAKMILLEYAFNTLNLRKICSDVISYNKRSLHYSLHCGYRIEGRRRKHVWRNGKFCDLIQLALFKEDWLPIWKKHQKTGKIR
jgi:RimJ/RimL family protein N-acetyltransferase